MDLQPISKVIREKKGMEKATQHLRNLQEKLKKDYKPEEYYDLQAKCNIMRKNMLDQQKTEEKSQKLEKKL